MLALLPALTRQMRSGMLEVIRQDYIRTARAKGLKESQVIVRHAIKNAIIPVVTLLGMNLRGLFQEQLPLKRYTQLMAQVLYWLTALLGETIRLFRHVF